MDTAILKELKRGMHQSCIFMAVPAAGLIFTAHRPGWVQWIYELVKDENGATESSVSITLSEDNTALITSTLTATLSNATIDSEE